MGMQNHQEARMRLDRSLLDTRSRESNALRALMLLDSNPAHARSPLRCLIL